MMHIGFPDPAAGEGGELAKLQLFRQVRDMIREQIVPFVKDYEDTVVDTHRLSFLTQGSAI